jgi:SHS family lactate transporter-like MFS transporter
MIFSGGIFAGFLSQYLGRRLTIIVFVILVGAFIPLWIIPKGFSALSAGAFCIQFGVQGAWGVIPIHLAEMSPPAFRSTFPGLSYQIGNMVSAASAQIEATGGEHQTTVIRGKLVPDYAKVEGIFLGVVAAYVVFMTIIGPENHSSHFELARAAFEEGAADGAVIQEDILVEKAAESGHESSSGSIRADEHRKEVV